MKTGDDATETRGPRPSTIRIVLGFLLCPFAPLLVFYLLFQFGPASFADEIENSWGNLFIVCLAIAVPATWIIGIPVLILLEKRQLRQLTAYIFCGIFAALICSIPFFPVAVIAVPTGAMIALLLWLVFWGLGPARSAS